MNLDIYKYMIAEMVTGEHAMHVCIQYTFTMFYINGFIFCWTLIDTHAHWQQLTKNKRIDR